MVTEQEALVRDSRQINTRLDMLVNRLLAPAEITAVQAHLLLYVLRHSQEGASMTALNRAYCHSKATVSKLVKRLREKDCVRVEPCREDDRRRLLFATDKARRLEPFLIGSIREAQDRLFRDFSPEELRELDRLQNKMLRNLAGEAPANSEKEATTR